MSTDWITESRGDFGAVIPNEFIILRVPTAHDMTSFISNHMLKYSRILRIIGSFQGSYLAVNEALAYASIRHPAMLLCCVDEEEIEICWTAKESSRKDYGR